MCKRAGRGHDPDGVNATKVGELALECPACPHPGKNLPDNWQTSAKQQVSKAGVFDFQQANLVEQLGFYTGLFQPLMLTFG